MGSAFELIVVSTSKAKADQFLQRGIAEIQRIESLLSEYLEQSVTSNLNGVAGLRSLQVPDEYYELVKRCIGISRLTQGAFDITVSPVRSLYDFKHHRLTIPKKDVLQTALSRTGYQHIQLMEKDKILLRKKGMALSFASIGKGYAADRVREIWLKAGVKSGVINAAGDLSVIGNKPDGSPWNIAIADPRDISKHLLNIPVREGSIATSGDYFQYFELNGTRYSHTINPSTGIPVNGIKSVSVQGISGELCDALATAVNVMGVDVGLHFINQLPRVHCLIVDDKNKLHFSENIKFERPK